jgi:arginyl-tRNA synthetase
MIFWAWRNLYAEVTRARIEGKQLNLKTAYENFVRMAFTREESGGVWRKMVQMVLTTTLQG